MQEGRYASIVAEDPHVDVYINDEKISGTSIVTSRDKTEFKCTEIEPVTKISARLSKDKMQAILEIKKIPGRKYYVKDQKPSNSVFIRSDYHEIEPAPATIEQCLEELKKLNVDPKFINIGRITELISRHSGGSAVVAEGIPPIDGLDSKIKLLFKIVAISPGRPKYEKGVISVVPTLLIDHDLDVHTGNIHFDGDIVIKGNVAENIKVFAGGNITVLGNVYHASVYAKGNIKVYGNIINSKVSAGLNMLIYLVIIPRLKRILETAEEYRNVVYGLQTSNNYGNIRRKLLQLAISKKDTLDKLIKDIRNLIKLSNYCNNDEEINRLASILEDVKTILTGINAKCMENPRLIKLLCTEINDYINEIKELCGTEANVIFEYGQNSFIQASSNIVVAKRGCYQCNLIAKDAILFKKASSVVLGGLLIARKRIKMGIVGAPSGISTYCKVLHRNGKIDAIYCYNNTVLNVNNNIKIIDSNNSYVHKNSQWSQAT